MFRGRAHLGVVVNALGVSPPLLRTPAFLRDGEQRLSPSAPLRCFLRVACCWRRYPRVFLPFPCCFVLYSCRAFTAMALLQNFMGNEVCMHVGQLLLACLLGLPRLSLMVGVAVYVLVRAGCWHSLVAASVCCCSASWVRKIYFLCCADDVDHLKPTECAYWLDLDSLDRSIDVGTSSCT